MKRYDANDIMPHMQPYWIYIMGSRNGHVVYTGVTNDLMRRVAEHRSGESEGFSKRYKCCKLLYYEEYNDVRGAIGREKEIKGWTRIKKNALIESMNPQYKDLADGWF